MININIITKYAMADVCSCALNVSDKETWCVCHITMAPDI